MQRGFVLVAVLVIMTVSLLIATGMLFMAQSRVADSASTADATQTRALAVSGLYAVMSRLNDQRERMLQGDLPRLNAQYTIYERSSVAGVVRLLPMTFGGEQVFAAEAGRLDINSCDADALAKTGMLDPAAAAAIISYRDQSLQRPFQSIAELLHIPGAGLSAENLYGPIEDIRVRDQAQLLRGDLAERVLSRLGGQQIRGLEDVLTVFSADPALQSNGKRRINLNTTWSEQLGDLVRERFGEKAADQLKSMFEQGVKFDSRRTIVRLLREADVPLRNWAEILDAFATEPDEVRFGLLDLNTASREALLGLPGITAEQAAQIISERQRLSPAERSSIAWPVVARIISPETFEAIVDRITTRCWMYRVRIAAGEVDAEHANGPLNSPMILEAVIDLSSPQPRLAMIRDITVLQAAAQIAVQASAAGLAAADWPTSTLRDQTSAATESVNSPDAAVPIDEAPALSDTDAAADSGNTGVSPARRRHIGRWIGG